MKPEDVGRYADAHWAPEYLSGLRGEVDRLPFEVAGLDVLDLAAGPGALTAVLLEAGAASVVWQDIEPEFERVARRRVVSDRVQYELRDLLDLPYRRASLDAVFIREALHWASDEWALVDRVRRILRPRGWLVVQAYNWRRALQMVHPRWKVAGHLISPPMAVVLRHKFVPTLWVSELLTRRRMRRGGFDIVEWRHPRKRDFVAIGRATP